MVNKDSEDTDMDVPAFHELLNPALRALHYLGGSASINELLEQVIEQEDYPPEVVEKEHGRGNKNGARVQARLGTHLPEEVRLDH